MDYSANKTFLMSKLAERQLPMAAIPEDILMDKEFIFDDSIREIPKVLNHANLSQCFVIEDHGLSGHPPGKRSPLRKGSSWRKHSECERKTSINSSSTLNLSEVKEVDFKITRKFSEWSRKDSKTGEICECREGSFSISPGHQSTNKLIQVLNVLKVTQKKSKKVNIKLLEKICEKLNLPIDTPAWHLNCTKLFQNKTDLLMGPFTSQQIMDLYDKKAINENTEIRMSLEVPGLESDSLSHLKGQDYRLKNLSKAFGFDQPKEKRKTSYPYQDTYYDYDYDYQYQYDNSVYQVSSNTNKKNAKKSSYNYSDEYYYNKGVGKRNNRNLKFLYIYF